MPGARLARWTSLVLVTLVLVVPSRAAQEELNPVTEQQRLSATFVREAAVVDQGQFRLEVRGLIGHDEQRTDSLQVIQRGFPAGDSDRNERRDDLREVTGGTIGAVGSYGLFKNAEVGFDLNGVIQGLRFADGSKENEADLGDMFLYGKYKYAANKNLAFAAGVDVRLPTGSESKRLGMGEVGTTPFLGARYSRGKLALGAHVGYQLNDDELRDVFNWSASTIVRATRRYALRAEIVGRHFTYGGAKFDDVMVMPGIDFIYSEMITFRPSGLAGITDEALDWGLGMGIALTF